MRHLLLLWLLLPVSFQLDAQGPATNGGAYKGLRIGVFHIEVTGQTARVVNVRCDVANTGRFALEFDSKHPAPAALIVEIDSLSLPVVLRGREEQLTRAVLQEKISLGPGEIRSKLSLRVPLIEDRPSTTPAQPVEEKPLSVAACGDLVFDTAFVASKDERRVVLHFVLKNNGPAPLRFYSPQKGESVAVNAYFVRETKLTRGATLAVSTVLAKNKDFPDGMLPAGQRLEAELDLDLAARTKFLPNVVLEVNPFQAACESDLTNNTWPVVLDF